MVRSTECPFQAGRAISMDAISTDSISVPRLKPRAALKPTPIHMSAIRAAPATGTLARKHRQRRQHDQWGHSDVGDQTTAQQ